MRRLPALATAALVSACTLRSGAPGLPPQAPLQVAESEFAADGVFYVANELGNSIFVYKVGGSSPLRKITQGIDQPFTVAVDRSGNLYVANQGHGNRPKGSVTVYAPGSDTPARTITKGIGQLAGMALDPAGDVFVFNSRAFDVHEYAAGATKIERTITDGIFSPRQLAVDASGYLYVANCQDCIYPTAHDTITVYRPKDEKLFSRFTPLVIRPVNSDSIPAASCSPISTADIEHLRDRTATTSCAKSSGRPARSASIASGNLYSGDSAVRQQRRQRARLSAGCENARL